MYNFYIKLPNIKVDCDRLLQEIKLLVNPDYSKTLCYSLTTHADHVNDINYDFELFPGVLEPPDTKLKT